MTNDPLWLIIGGTILLLVGLSAISLLLSDDSLAMMRIRFLRYYRVGDLVTFGHNLQGRVTAINLFTTTLLTAEQDRVIISNRAVLSSAIITHTNLQPATPSPTNRAPLNVTVEENSPSDQPLNRSIIANAVTESSITESPITARPVDRTVDIVVTTPLPANLVGDKAQLPPINPTPDLLPPESLAASATPPRVAAEQVVGEHRGLRAGLPPGLQPLPWTSHKPLGKRPRLGTKSVGALSFGMIPVMRRDKVVVKLPIDQPEETNEPAKTSHSRPWRFGPTAWRAIGTNRK